MPQLTVPLPLWITSQVLAVFALICAMWAFQIKSKKLTLLMIAIACVFNSTSSAFINNWVVASMLAVSVIRCFIFAYLEHRKEKGKYVSEKLTFVLMLVFMLATCILVAFFWSWWFDFVLLAASLGTIYGNRAKGIHAMRITCLCYDTLVIVNHIVFFNIVGIIMQILIVSSSIVFYIRYFANKRKQKETLQPLT